MPENRIQIIIREINYWKESKLLPEAYCDYLLALYTHGEGSYEKNEYQGKRIKVSLIIQFFLLTLMLPLSFIVSYFINVHPFIQISMLCIFLILSFWVYVLYKKSKNGYCFFPLTIALIVILLITVFISDLYISNLWIKSMLILLNFIGWFLVGLKKHLTYLMIGSVVAILFALLYTFL